MISFAAGGMRRYVGAVPSEPGGMGSRGYRIIYDKFHINSHFLFSSDLWSMPKVNL
jgi:hypothetical protein